MPNAICINHFLSLLFFLEMSFHPSTTNCTASANTLLRVDRIGMRSQRLSSDSIATAAGQPGVGLATVRRACVPGIKSARFAKEGRAENSRRLALAHASLAASRRPGSPPAGEEPTRSLDCHVT